MLNKNENKNKRLIPIHAKLDSLADCNWISTELVSKYKIKTSKCNVVCKLVDKSEVYIDQCCNLLILVKMYDKAKLKIECNFIIIDSEQDLVLGWDAIKTLNLMEVKVSDSSETKIVANLTNKKITIQIWFRSY